MEGGEVLMSSKEEGEAEGSPQISTEDWSICKDP